MYHSVKRLRIAHANASPSSVHAPSARRRGFLLQETAPIGLEVIVTGHPAGGPSHLEPLDSPRMADFVANLDRINALAENSPGFVWRLQTEEGDATAMRPMGDTTLVNMSIWRDAESLNKYVYQSAHVEIMRRRKEWFERMREAYVVLWWVRKGLRPSISEAIAKLEFLRAHGPTAEAFTFRHAFASPDAPQSRPPVALGDECPAT
jgi:hypothetical protein